MTETVEIAQQCFQVHNGRDLDGVGALLGDDPEFELVGVWTLRGRDRVLRLTEWDAALNTRLQPADLRVEGGMVTCHVVERNDWFTAVGLDEIQHEQCELHVVDGRIVKIRSTMEPESYRATAEALGRIIGWARQACPDELGAPMPGGQFEYNGRNARRWLALLAHWRQAGESPET
jgi:hypothetical protein